jgi:NADH dehydrogenase/NADH:ubiquinone oxidoreductase 75 kD subunit (chain G)
MKEITLNFDGKDCKGIIGDTILEVAQKNDVYIPTLCYLKGLSPIGACRMCVVEVEKNPKLLTSCTTPAADGMVVHTKTEKLHNYRKQILELLFAGRNHFCMYCSQSGDCELQRLAIEHGMDSVRYPFLYAPFENDATHPDLMMDHNRCVLCLRCIRVCAEKVGAHTLDLQKRGWSATVCADMGMKLGDSSTCVSCGACAQVCPTGTITIRELAYRGRRKDCDDVVESVCPLCSVGCKIKAYVRTGSVARVEGTGTESPDGGQLCHMGRWWLPESTERERVAVPMIREGAHFREASWEEALALVAEKIKPAAESGKAGALVSSLCTDEELALFSAFYRDALKVDIDTFDGDILRGFVKGFEPFKAQGVRPFTGAHNILDSDLVVNLCADPQDEAPVVASYVRVAVLRNNAKMVFVGNMANPFEGLTDESIRLGGSCGEPVFLQGLAQALMALAESKVELDGMTALDNYEKSLCKVAELAGITREKAENLVKLLASAEKPVFILGKNLAKSPAAVTAAVNLAIAARSFFEDGLGIVPLVSSGNSLGSINTCVSDEPWLRANDKDFLYVYSTGMIPEDEDSLAAISRSGFSVIQTPYLVRPLVNLADVLLPAPAWFERSGHFCTIEGERRRLNVIVPPVAALKGLSSVFDGVARDIGISVGRPETAPCEQFFVSSVSPELAKMAAL